MVISMRSTRVKQFLLKIVKFVFCHSKNTTKLYMSGSHNSTVTRQQINRDMHACKKTLKKLIWTKKKNQAPEREIEPGTAQISQKQ